MVKELLIFILSIQILFGQSIQVLEVEKISSSLNYTMKNPIHSWNGDCNNFSCKIWFDINKYTIERVEAEAKIISFDSNVKMRDAKSFKSLESSLFPVVTFRSTQVIEKNNEILVFGKLEFHGISKDISFKVSKNIHKNQIAVLGNFSIKLTDFNLSPPNLMGMKAENNITIKFLVNFIMDKR